MHSFYRSEGRDPNGICYPCVMGWGLAGTGNSSAVAVAAAVAAAAPGGKIAKTLGLFKESERKDGKTRIYCEIGKSGFRKLRWGPLDSAERCVLKS